LTAKGRWTAFLDRILPKRLQEHAKARDVAELCPQLNLVNFLTGSFGKPSERLNNPLPVRILMR
jgi:hypothetical protein